MPTVVRRWFRYKGAPLDRNLPSSYELVVDFTCVNGDDVCVIQAIYNNTITPVSITTKLQGYIASLLTTGIAQPTGIGVTKIFVYGKSV